MAEEGAEQLKQRCLDAYRQQALQMTGAGIAAVLIENAAHAAGMKEGPFTLQGDPPAQQPAVSLDVDVESVKQRLLCAQALAAAECWEKGSIDPALADLASTLGWGFPGYTGGVMSYMDTMGLLKFIELCDHLNSQAGAGFDPSPWLRQRALQDDRVYPSTA